MFFSKLHLVGTEMTSIVSTVIIFVQKIKTGILSKIVRNQQYLHSQSLENPRKVELFQNANRHKLRETIIREFEVTKNRVMIAVRRPPL